MILNCNSCNHLLRVESVLSTMVVCSQCYSMFRIEGIRLEKFSLAGKIEEDMSPVKIGTTGSTDGKKFTVVGRTRFIFDDYFLNQWNILFENQRFAFLGEYGGNYSIYEENKNIFEGKSYKNLNPGHITLANGRKPFIVISSAKIREIDYEGEIYKTPSTANFSLIEFLGKNKEMLHAHLYMNGLADVYLGRSYEFKELKFSQLREIKS